MDYVFSKASYTAEEKEKMSERRRFFSEMTGKEVCRYWDHLMSQTRRKYGEQLKEIREKRERGEIL